MFSLGLPLRKHHHFGAHREGFQALFIGRPSPLTIPLYPVQHCIHHFASNIHRVNRSANNLTASAHLPLTISSLFGVISPSNSEENKSYSSEEVHQAEFGAQAGENQTEAQPAGSPKRSAVSPAPFLSTSQSDLSCLVFYCPSHLAFTITAITFCFWISPTEDRITLRLYYVSSY